MARRLGRGEKMTYNLYLEVLKEENEPGSPAAKWLQVKISDEDTGYTETAYIKVDVKRWENQKQLEIFEGWIEATSTEIERFLAERGLAADGKGLVVPFDRKHDLLGEVKGLELPKRRLSAQDAIALFFAVEDEMPVSAVPIRTARQMLSAQKDRNEWLGPVKSPMDHRTATSQAHGQRRRMIPFRDTAWLDARATTFTLLASLKYKSTFQFLMRRAP